MLPPTLALLDNFNRANANSLGASWSQANTGAAIDLRVNGNQVVANQLNDGGVRRSGTRRLRTEPGRVDPADVQHERQPRRIVLILKANGGTTANPTNYIRVRFDTQGTDGIYVETTTNAGGAFTQYADLDENLSDNEVLFAAAYSDGMVAVYSINGATTTFARERPAPDHGRQHLDHREPAGSVSGSAPSDPPRTPSGEGPSDGSFSRPTTPQRDGGSPHGRYEQAEPP